MIKNSNFVFVMASEYMTVYIIFSSSTMSYFWAAVRDSKTGLKLSCLRKYVMGDEYVEDLRGKWTTYNSERKVQMLSKLERSLRLVHKEQDQSIRWPEVKDESQEQSHRLLRILILILRKKWAACLAKMKRFNNNFWKLLKETVIRSLGHTDAAVVL